MIRPFHENDTEAVVRLWQEALRSSHTFLPDRFWDSLEDDIRTLFLPMSDEIVLHIDDASGEIDAFLAFSEDYLGAICVAPEMQGRGLGSRMFRIARRMHPGLTLTVYKDNTSAVAFYGRHGLRILAERVDEKSGCVEFVMGCGQPDES